MWPIVGLGGSVMTIIASCVGAICDILTSLICGYHDHNHMGGSDGQQRLAIVSYDFNMDVDMGRLYVNMIHPV